MTAANVTAILRDLVTLLLACIVGGSRAAARMRPHVTARAGDCVVEVGP